MITYNRTSLFNLTLTKEAYRWHSGNLISREQRDRIIEEHPVMLYHPNFIIRILLFIATLIALTGITGILGLIFADGIEHIIEAAAIFYGIISWFFLENLFIKNNKHYKSGVNEALLYHSLGWTIGGLTALANFDIHFTTVICIVAFGIAAIRYADLICTALSYGAFAYFVFYEFYSMGGVFTQLIPIVFLIIFTIAYFFIRKIQRLETTEPWDDCLALLEGLALLTIYAAGNYLVVRELTLQLLGFELEPGEDIPFAFLFYTLTVAIPITYLYFGITKRDIALIRVSLLVLAFSVFTFKYYYSLGHPEITWTISGAVLLSAGLLLFRYLRVIRHGFTRENLLKEKWADANPEAFIISQTMGGNKPIENTPIEKGGGGAMGGAGSSDPW